MQEVLIVAANRALPDYLKLAAYFCQPGRTFRPTTHMAFYADGAVQPFVPMILDSFRAVPVTEQGIRGLQRIRAEAQQRLLELLPRLGHGGTPEPGKTQGVMLLSPHDDPRTIRLQGPVRNVQVASTGRPIAFVQG